MKRRRRRRSLELRAPRKTVEVHSPPPPPPPLDPYRIMMEGLAERQRAERERKVELYKSFVARF